MGEFQTEKRRVTNNADDRAPLRTIYLIAHRAVTTKL